MKVRLLVRSARTTVNEVTLQAFPATIGRHRDCKLRVTSRRVSRRHCVLEARGDRLAVRDLDSANGTYVNGERLQGERILDAGDLLEVGPIGFEVTYLSQGFLDDVSVPNGGQRLTGSPREVATEPFFEPLDDDEEEEHGASLLQPRQVV